MKRRDFITLISGGAAWPLAARAQQADRMRRVGVIQTLARDDPEERVRIAAFLRGLQELGWRATPNGQFNTRWATAKADEIRRNAAEWAALAPDVIVAHGASPVGATLQATRRCRSYSRP